ncbi:OmpH family outer membrane protein [Chitinimonas viridis]|uniref:OmpH family outer membrane protein n=1 Tax=Chitinimonas viridis TaxID=664880 RepID=A0ABT8B1X7_9NEIS|nr:MULTISPECIES: OmpH family outer membrane protein [Chitinimonas]MDN3576000.1 OmpH family outer membrane protein [Chitinimonas viridis]
MKRLFSLILAAGLMTPAIAQDIKVGFVNLDRIMRESGPAVKAVKKIEKEFAGRDADIKKLTEQVRGRQVELDKGGLTMPETERRNKERELVKLNQDLARIQREFREDLNARRNEELSGIQERVYNTIQQIAAQEKYDAILQEAVYVNPKLDITDKVLKSLSDK